MRENFISLSRCSCLFTLILRGCLASLSAENSKIKLDQRTFLVAQKNLPHFPTLYFGTFFGGEIFGKIFCLRYQLSFFSRFERQFQKDIQSYPCAFFSFLSLPFSCSLSLYVCILTFQILLVQLHMDGCMYSVHNDYQKCSFPLNRSVRRRFVIIP